MESPSGSKRDSGIAHLCTKFRGSLTRCHALRSKLNPRSPQQSCNIPTQTGKTPFEFLIKFRERQDDEHRNSADAFGTETRLLDQATGCYDELTAQDLRLKS